MERTNTMKNINMKTIVLALFALLLVAAVPVSAQVALPTTTLSTGVPVSPNLAAQPTLSLASCTNITAPALPTSTSGVGDPSGQTYTFLYIDADLYKVNSILSTSPCLVAVEAGTQGTYTSGHNSGATVYIAASYYLLAKEPAGACTAATSRVTPYINPVSRNFWSCPASGANAGVWTKLGTVDSFTFTDGYFFVPPSACSFFPTTVTQTTTWAPLGASNVFVVNSTTNSAAGTVTMTCTVTIPSRLTTNKGAYITDITVSYGAQTSAITTLGTPTLGAITLPTAAANETASTVTPVAAGGTLTASSTTGNLAITTAGSFYTNKITLGTPLHTADLTVLQFTLPFNNTASSVLTVNSPGLVFHYEYSPI
jgi:hypothetical protein